MRHRPLTAHPEAMLDWDHVYWPDGAGFRLGQALTGETDDGDTITTAIDEIGAVENITQATESLQPHFRLHVPALYGRALEGRDTANGYLQDAFASDITQPFTIVTLGRFPDDPGANVRIYDGESSGVSALWVTASGIWRVNAGANLDSTVDLSSAVTDPALVVAHYNGASSFVEVNGTRTTGNAGTQDLDGFTLFARRNGNDSTDWQMAFVGIYDGDPTTDANWATFEAWCRTRGAPVT